nr:MAG TPA: helix-turn-helix domain protein [Caudoviricetes sp.]
MSTYILYFCPFCRQIESQNMEPVKVLAILQFLTNKFITQADIAEALGITKSAVNKKLIRDSHFRPGEIEQIEKHFGVKFSDFKLATPNTLQPKDNEQILKNYEFFGHRLAEVQEELGYLDKAMARIMGIDEKRYIRIKLGKEDATTEQLVRLASKVDVSLDWLVKGE